MMLKRKKLFFITAGVVTIVVVTIILVLLFNIQAFKPRIEAAASDALGMDVRIKGRLGIALFPGIGISLNDVSVRNKGAKVVSVEKMTIGLKFIALARREILISRVALTRPVFTIVRYKNGTFNFEKPGHTPSGRPLAVRKISVSEGDLVYTDDKSTRRIEVDDLALTIRNLSYGGTDGAGPFKDLSFEGDVSCKTLALNDFNLKNLVLRTAMRSGIFEVNPVSMNVFHGKWTGNIHVDMTGASPHYRIAAAVDRFRIEDLIQASSPGNKPQEIMEGTAGFSSDLTATGKSVDEVMRSLNGRLSLNGKDLMLYSIDIDALIPKYERSQNFNLMDVGAYFLVGPYGPILTKSYNFASMYKESRVGKRCITKLVSIWDVKNGIAGATDVALATKKYRIAMKGGLDFNNDQFVDVTVAVLDKRGCAVYSQKVHGPFRKPQVEKVNIFKSITGPVSNALEDAKQFIQGKKCEVFYSGSVVQPE